MRLAVALAVLTLPAALAHAQAQPQTPPAAPPAAPPPAIEPQAEMTTPGSATDLVSQLGDKLNITPKQAEGAAGAMFGLAKTRLKPEEFAKVSASLSGMDGLLNAAPPLDPSTAFGKTGLVGLVGPFQKLGLSPEVATKAAPILADYMGKSGGKEVAKLVTTALK